MKSRRRVNSDVGLLKLMETPENALDLLKRWHHRARFNQRAHYEMEERCSRRASFSGTASAILSAIVGVLLLVAVRINPPPTLRIATASISIIVAAITAIATYAKWSEKAAQHHSAAAEYGKIFRKIEETIAVPPASDDLMLKSVKTIREKLDQIPGDAPPVPKRVWRKLSAHLTRPADDTKISK
jgi:hypothetical protein